MLVKNMFGAEFVYAEIGAIAKMHGLSVGHTHNGYKSALMLAFGLCSSDALQTRIKNLLIELDDLGKCAVIHTIYYTILDSMSTIKRGDNLYPLLISTSERLIMLIHKNNNNTFVAKYPFDYKVLISSIYNSLRFADLKKQYIDKLKLAYDINCSWEI
jgi:hypothetical protein